MKKISIILFGAVLLGFIWLMYLVQFSSRSTKNIQTKTIPSVLPHVQSFQMQKSIFVPYWNSTITSEDESYIHYYYFGIRPTREGKIDTDAGLNSISLVTTIPSKKKKLVLRMLDSTITEVILKDKTVQKTLVSAVRNILTENTFSGLVLDLEVPFTLQADKEKQITEFVQQMCTGIKANYKSCSMLVYGDFSYRKRPYDLKKLSQYTDKILLMAYDFHKAGGEPGPNFPFDSGSTISPSLRASPSNINYGYDFKQMISDAVALVPKEKIEVVFGMYGYDWTLNEQGTPLKGANALSLNGIRALISNDKLQITNQSQITSSKEKNIEYLDKDGRKHVIWYEDEESAQIKTNYLQGQGISQVSYWAYGYY